MCLHINIVPLFRPLGCYYKPQHRPSIPRLPPLLSHLPVSVPAASSGYRLYGRACLSGNVTHSCSQSHNIPALYSLCNPPPWQESKRGPNAHRPQYRSHLISSHHSVVPFLLLNYRKTQSIYDCRVLSDASFLWTDADLQRPAKKEKLNVALC